jgi:hypothetical protein
MPFSIKVVGLLLVLAALSAAAQTIPAEVASAPVRMVLDKPTIEVPRNATVAYTVTLRNAGNRPVIAPQDIRVEIETTGYKSSVVITKGQFSSNFQVPVSGGGVSKVSVRSGKLGEASSLILVTPEPGPRSALQPETPQSTLETADRPLPSAMMTIPSSARPSGESASRATAASRPRNELRLSPRTLDKFGATVDRSELSAEPAIKGEGTLRLPASAAPGLQPAPPPPAIPQPAAELLKPSIIKIYVQPEPIYEDPISKSWKASVSAAVMGDQHGLVAAPQDISIHFTSSLGDFTPADVTIPQGKSSNFNSSTTLTSTHSGHAHIEVAASLSSEPLDVDYVPALPALLGITLSDKPGLERDSSSVARFRVCLYDAGKQLTSYPDRSVQVSLSPTLGSLDNDKVNIDRGEYCSGVVKLTSHDSGTAQVQAVSGSELQPGGISVVFPPFSWFLVIFAAVGGLGGAFVSSWSELSSAHWWSHVWRNLLLGVIFGVIVYLLVYFGALNLPKDFPINLQYLPTVTGIGAFLLGFVGGLYGRKLLKVDPAEA